MRKLFRIAALTVLLCLGSAVCLAETLDLADADFHFVDARGETGYYVDMQSVQFHNDHEVTARVEIVRADIDRLYLYTARFDRVKRLYQILRSTVATYATKEIAGGSGAPSRVTAYAAGSPMEAVVEYIFSPAP